MKIFSFLRWQWNRFELWQKTFLGAGLLMITAFIMMIYGASPQLVSIMSTTSLIIVLGWMIKWALIDKIIDSYEAFKQEQNTLFHVIKTSDKDEDKKAR